jgi:hypothetical protein
MRDEQFVPVLGCATLSDTSRAWPVVGEVT